jgi:hypothetical protein
MMCGRKVIKTLGSQKSSINVINMESICREVTDLEYVNSKDTLAQAKYQDIGKCHTAKMFDIVTHWLCCCVTRKNKPGGGQMSTINASGILESLVISYPNLQTVLPSLFNILHIMQLGPCSQGCLSCLALTP